MNLPERVYLTRKDVLAAVGGRVQLEMLEASRQLQRHYPTGYTRARYLRAEVQSVLDRLRGPTTKPA